MINSSALRMRINTMLPELNERQRRLFLAAEAKAIGYGGITQVSKISGV
ncbi:MAG: ISAzo13 family transposase, partial [Treponema sp.]|nr:ISAzo13 family transposase [Treponema sp.]